MNTQGHSDVVGAVKEELVLRGVSLVGPCGAYQITRRVAWVLKDEGAGLLDKPFGNACDGYAVDIICYSDGRIFDCLALSGGAEDANHEPIPGTGNEPIWLQQASIDPARYRRPHDPEDAIVTGQPPAHAPTPASAGEEDYPIDGFPNLDRYLKSRTLQTFQKIDATDAKIDALEQRLLTAVEHEARTADTAARSFARSIDTPLPRKKGR